MANVTARHNRTTFQQRGGAMLCWTTESPELPNDGRGVVGHLTRFAAMIGVLGASVAYITAVSETVPNTAPGNNTQIQPKKPIPQMQIRQRIREARPNHTQYPWESPVRALTFVYPQSTAALPNGAALRGPNLRLNRPQESYDSQERI